MDLVLNLGKKWSEISKQLPGRNENAVKNRFFSLLRKERKKKNYTNLKLENASFTFDQENFTNSEEINLINIIISEKSVKKKEKESSIQEIKLINLTNTLENIKLNPVIIDSSSEILLQKAENFENFKLKTEVIEEAKSNSLPSNPNINISPAANNYSNNQTNITYNNNHSRALPNNMSSNGFLPHQQNLNFCGNPHISDHNINNPYYNNIIFQNIPKLIQMNNFGYLNPFSFPQIPSQQMPPQIPIPLYDNLKYNQFSQPYSPQDFEKYDNVIYNHPLFQNQPNIIYNQTPQTLKNNENEKRDSTFSNHPLVENTNEKPTNETNIVINNSTESFPNFNLDFQYNQSRQINSIPNTAQFNNSNANNETPEEYLWKFKIKNGLELNKADYGNCLYSVVNLSKRELYVFSPLSNPSESNRSIFSNLFKNAPSSFGSNNIEDYISFNSGNRSLTKNEIVINNNNQSESFRKIKKNKTYNSLVSSHPSSGNISKEININNTQLSYSPTHSPRKDSKFKGAKDNFGFFE